MTELIGEMKDTEFDARLIKLLEGYISYCYRHQIQVDGSMEDRPITLEGFANWLRTKDD